MHSLSMNDLFLHKNIVNTWTYVLFCHMKLIHINSSLNFSAGIMA